MGVHKNYIVLLLGLINLLLHRPVLLAASSITSSGGDDITNCSNTANFNWRNFPVGFAFGTSSSSYQYEGGANESGRTPSIWDTYTHKYPGKIADGSNGDVAIDSYHRYKEDVAIMKEMNLNAYRFSISWRRILPKGRSSGGINKEGIKYYNNLINELIFIGIEPYATLFHFDAPQILEDEYGEFLSPRAADGVNVRGYFPWMLFDDFEWNEGYTSKFGINYVDFKNGLKRYPKKSARWFKNFLKK